MSIAEKLQTIAENEQKVYDAGKQAEYDAFWDAFQDYGNPAKYTAAFRGYNWTDEIYNPKYPIECDPSSGATDAIDGLFLYSQITDTKVPITYVPSTSTTASSVFSSAKKLVTIRKITVGTRLTYSGWFNGCTALTNLTVAGTIGQNGFDVSKCTNLTHDSLMSIINALRDFSGTSTTKTVTLGSTNLEKLTDTEKVIATQKGWTLA